MWWKLCNSRFTRTVQPVVGVSPLNYRKDLGSFLDRLLGHANRMLAATK